MPASARTCRSRASPPGTGTGEGEPGLASECSLRNIQYQLNSIGQLQRLRRLTRVAENRNAATILSCSRSISAKASTWSGARSRAPRRPRWRRSGLHARAGRGPPHYARRAARRRTGGYGLEHPGSGTRRLHAKQGLVHQGVEQLRGICRTGIGAGMGACRGLGTGIAVIRCISPGYCVPLEG